MAQLKKLWDKHFKDCCGMDTGPCKVCCEKVTQEADRALAHGHAIRLIGILNFFRGELNIIEGMKLSNATRAFVGSLSTALRATSLWGALTTSAGGAALDLDDPAVALMLAGLPRGEALERALEGLQAEFQDLQAALRDLHDECLVLQR